MAVQHKAIKRKQYSSEFKREVVRLVTEGRLTIAQIARDLGLNDNLISRWKKEAQLNGQCAFPGQGHPQDEELSRLRRELEAMTRQHEILKVPKPAKSKIQVLPLQAKSQKKHWLVGLG